MEPREVSIATSFDYGVALDAQIPLISKAGFTHVSLGVKPEHSAYLTPAGQTHLRTLTEHHGLGIDTIHGPRADTWDSLGAVSRSVTAAAALRVPIVVAHASPFDFPEAEFDDRLGQVVGVCGALAPVLAATGVRLALENVLPGPATDLVERVLDRLDPEWFGFCYDSSHDQIGGPRPMDLLARLRHRLIAVQLSDRARDFVDHMLPGEGFIHWRDVCSELSQAGFDRPLLLEVATTNSVVKEPSQFVRLAHRQGMQLKRNEVARHGSIGQAEPAGRRRSVPRLFSR
jgi:sugar phosphate isomerase/epimerase